MNKVILTDDLRSQLNGLNQPVEVCEPSGQTVGHFVPQGRYLRLLAAWDEKQISDDELRRRADAPGGKPLADVLARLGNGR
ncbi:MAG: hypothetical protein U0746_17255 [Gemmataceae bacterium]